MNKKVFAIILIVCLAFGVAFAAKSSGLRVGAQAGYGGYSLKFTSKNNDNNYLKVSNGGFYFAGTAEYALSKELSAKVEAGINLMGTFKGSYSYYGFEGSIDTGIKQPIQFSIYAGAQYCIEVSKQFCIDLGAGFDVLMGKMVEDKEGKKNESFNAAMGIGIEAAAAYHVNDNIKLSVGGKFAWHFINTNKDLDDFIYDIGNSINTTNLAFQAYAGCTYAF